MAGRQKQPIDLIIEKGKKHLTKQEIEERRNTEVKVEHLNVKPPNYLSVTQKKEFNKIANILLDCKIMSELDEDCLARYLISRDNYVKFTKQLNLQFRIQNSKKCKEDTTLQIITAENIDTYLTYQDKTFKQCRAAASDLGLSISSRCRLVMPTSPPQEKVNKFKKFKVIA